MNKSYQRIIVMGIVIGMLFPAFQFVNASNQNINIFNIDKVEDNLGGYFVVFNVQEKANNNNVQEKANNNNVQEKANNNDNDADNHMINKVYFTHVADESQTNAEWLANNFDNWMLISNETMDSSNPEIVFIQDTAKIMVLWAVKQENTIDFYYTSSIDSGVSWTESQFGETIIQSDWDDEFDLRTAEDGLLSIWWNDKEQLLITPDIDGDGIPDDLQQVEVDPGVTGETLLCSNRMRVGLANIVNISDLNVELAENDGMNYQNLSIEGWDFTTDFGMPKLPSLKQYIMIPYDSTISLTTYYSSYSTEQGYNVYPLPFYNVSYVDETDLVNATKEEFYINETFYSSNSFYPEDIVSIGLDTYLRHNRVILLEITPFQFNPVTRELRVYNEITISTEFGQTGLSAVQNQISGADGGYFKDTYSNLILNYGESADWGVIESTNLGPGQVFRLPFPPGINPPQLNYLIITHDDFYDNPTLNVL